MLVDHRHAASDPTTTATVHRSDAALKAGRAQEAEQLARAAIARDNRYVPARLALGRALEALGKHVEAASVYADAARISPFSTGVSGSLRRVWLAPLTGFGIVALVLWAIFRIVGRHFDAFTVLVGLLISTAVLIAGTLVMLQRRRRRFASLSAEDRELLQAHGRGELLAGPASSRIMAVTAVIVLLSAAAIVFAVGTKPSLGMKIGDCFTLDKQTSIEQVSAIPCALPHGTEIYAVIMDPAPLDAPFPRMRSRLRAIHRDSVHDRLALLDEHPVARGALLGDRHQDELVRRLRSQRPADHGLGQGVRRLKRRDRALPSWVAQCRA